MRKPACQVRTSRKPGEIQIPFGETADRRLIHISRVTAGGAACGCHCPACGEPLLAYIGGRRAKHFGHKANGRCAHAYETALHRYAKEVIERSNGVWCPAVVVDDGSGPIQRYKPAWVDLRDVRLEHRFHGIIPDVIATSADGTKSLLIEMAVTHAADSRKKQILDQQEIAAIEIDLSALTRQESLEDLDELILKRAPRSWLYNPHVADADLNREQRERLHAEQNAAPVLALLADGADARRIPDGVGRRLRTARRELEVMELHHFTGLPVGSTRALTAGNQDWQALFLRDWIDKHGVHASQPQPQSVAEFLKANGFLHWQVTRLTPRGAQVLRERVPGFLMPEELGAAYLSALVASGFLDPRGRTQPALLLRAHEKLTAGRREAAAAAARQMREEQARAQAAAKAAADAAAKEREDAVRRAQEQARVAGRARLWAVVEPILARVGEDARRRFHFDQWLTVTLEFSMPEEMMASPYFADRFVEQLNALARLFEPGAEPAKSLLGLPLEEVQAQRVAERDAAIEQRKQQLFEQRMETFRGEFPDLAGDEAWLCGWNRQLYGQSPKEALSGSEGFVRSVYAIAADERRDRASRTQRAYHLQGRLRTLAISKLGEGKGNTWMDTTVKGLKPAAYCVDVETYLSCIAALEKVPGVKLAQREKEVPR